MEKHKIIEFLQDLQEALDVDCCQASLDAEDWSYRIDDIISALEDFSPPPSKTKKTNISNRKSEVGTSGPCKCGKNNCSPKTQ